MEFTSIRGRQATNNKVRKKSEGSEWKSKKVIVPWEKEDSKARGIGNVDKWAHPFKKLRQGKTYCEADTKASNWRSWESGLPLDEVEQDPEVDSACVW